MIFAHGVERSERVWIEPTSKRMAGGRFYRKLVDISYDSILIKCLASVAVGKRDVRMEWIGRRRTWRFGGTKAAPRKKIRRFRFVIFLK